MRGARAVLVLVPVLAGAALVPASRHALEPRAVRLKPDPAAAQALDEQLRTDAGAPEMRYVVIVSAADREGALNAAQALGARLTPLMETGAIGGFESPARYLPALAVQRARQASLPPRRRAGART